VEEEAARRTQREQDENARRAAEKAERAARAAAYEEPEWVRASEVAQSDEVRIRAGPHAECGG
jgi:hypothetical protein